MQSEKNTSLNNSFHLRRFFTSIGITWIVCALVAIVASWLTLQYLRGGGKLDSQTIGNYIAFVFATAVSFAGALVTIRIASVAVDAQNAALKLQEDQRRYELRRDFNARAGTVPEQLFTLSVALNNALARAVSVYELMVKLTGEAMTRQSLDVAASAPIPYVAGTIDPAELTGPATDLKEAMTRAADALGQLANNPYARQGFREAGSNYARSLAPHASLAARWAAELPVVGEGHDANAVDLAYMAELCASAAADLNTERLVEACLLAMAAHLGLARIEQEGNQLSEESLERLGDPRLMKGAALAFLGAAIFTDRPSAGLLPQGRGKTGPADTLFRHNFGLLLLIDLYNVTPTRTILGHITIDTILGQGASGDSGNGLGKEIDQVPFFHAPLYESAAITERDRQRWVYSDRYRSVIQLVSDAIGRDHKAANGLVGKPQQMLSLSGDADHIELVFMMVHALYSSREAARLYKDYQVWAADAASFAARSLDDHANVLRVLNAKARQLQVLGTLAALDDGRTGQHLNQATLILDSIEHEQKLRNTPANRCAALETVGASAALVEALTFREDTQQYHWLGHLLSVRVALLRNFIEPCDLQQWLEHAIRALEAASQLLTTRPSEVANFQAVEMMQSMISGVIGACMDRRGVSDDQMERLRTLQLTWQNRQRPVQLPHDLV